MKYEAVIFDLDGTLLDTLEDLKDSVNYALGTYNYPLHTTQKIRSFVGNGIRKLIERAIPNGEDNPYFEECLLMFKTHYKANCRNKTRAYDGIIELIQKLNDMGYKLAVVSNKYAPAVKELCNYYFKDIKVAIGECEGVRRKPFPDSVIMALNELGVDKTKAIYVGDSEVDLLTAKNSNIPCISVTWGFRNKEFLAENGGIMFANTPEEILNFI